MGLLPAISGLDCANPSSYTAESNCDVGANVISEKEADPRQESASCFHEDRVWLSRLLV